MRLTYCDVRHPFCFEREETTEPEYHKENDQCIGERVATYDDGPDHFSQESVHPAQRDDEDQAWKKRQTPGGSRRLDLAVGADVRQDSAEHSASYYEDPFD